MATGEALPLRPLTVGELLDAAVGVLRRRMKLFGFAVLLAAGEQAVLYPLRAAVLTDPYNYFGRPSSYWAWWLLVCVGMGTEAALIAVLGARAAPVALAALLGGQTPWRPPTRRASVRIVLLALIVGAGAALSFGLGVIGWLVWYGFTGLAGPCLMTDARAENPAGRGSPGSRPRYRGVWAALGRSVILVARNDLRPAGIRLMAYLVWWILRFALGAYPLLALVTGFGLHNRIWLIVLTSVAATVVNGLAYAVLGCLDAVTHLEARMRVEGIDIALNRAIRAGAAVAPILAAP